MNEKRIIKTDKSFDRIPLCFWFSRNSLIFFWIVDGVVQLWIQFVVFVYVLYVSICGWNITLLFVFFLRSFFSELIVWNSVGYGRRILFDCSVLRCKYFYTILNSLSRLTSQQRCDTYHRIRSFCSQFYMNNFFKRSTLIFFPFIYTFIWPYLWYQFLSNKILWIFIDFAKKSRINIVHANWNGTDIGNDLLKRGVCDS